MMSQNQNPVKNTEAEKLATGDLVLEAYASCMKSSYVEYDPSLGMTSCDDLCCYPSLGHPS